MNLNPRLFTMSGATLSGLRDNFDKDVEINWDAVPATTTKSDPKALLSDDEVHFRCQVLLCRSLLWLLEKNEKALATSVSDFHDVLVRVQLAQSNCCCIGVPNNRASNSNMHYAV